MKVNCASKSSYVVFPFLLTDSSCVSNRNGASDMILSTTFDQLCRMFENMSVLIAVARPIIDAAGTTFTPAVAGSSC